MERYKKWPVEINLTSNTETGYLLQYDLKRAENDCVIPFQIVEWAMCDGEHEDWNEESTEIEIVYKGEIWFDGIRHSDFTGDRGYINYIKPKSLSRGLDILNSLCQEYCTSYYPLDE